MYQNHSLKYQILNAFFIVGLVACSKETTTTEVTWSRGSKQPPPEIINNSQFKTKELSIVAANETIERSPQRVGKAFVENSYLQTIKNKEGELVFVKSSYIGDKFDKLLPEIEKRDLQKFAFLESLKKTNFILKNAKEIFPPKVLIVNQPTGAMVAYQIDYVDAAGTGAFRMKYSPVVGFISTERVSSGFEEGRGIVFPSGPKSSDLSEVILKGLLGDGTLTKSNLMVSTETNEKAHSASLIFDYDPQDVRFDQVQVFFYVDKTLAIFRDKLGLTLPFNLDVQTHYGAPEKKNAMFYYPSGQIRLGTGDGISYSNVMKDPSIVTHETCHAFIEALARLPYGSGEGASLNEGFADFFTAVFLANPNLGEVAYMKGPYKRTILNDSKVSQKNNGLYHDSLILSGFFWDVKTSLGDQKALSLAVKTLSRLGPNGNFSTVAPAVQFALDTDEFSASDKKVVNDFLKQREFL